MIAHIFNLTAEIVISKETKIKEAKAVKETKVKTAEVKISKSLI